MLSLFKTTKQLVGALVLLNVLDLVMTVGLFRRGWIVEENPFLAFLLGISTIYFAVAKIALATICTLVLSFLDHHRWARWGLGVVTVVYALVVLRTAITILTM